MTSTPPKLATQPMSTSLNATVDMSVVDAKDSEDVARRASIILAQHGATVRATVAAPSPEAPPLLPLPVYRTHSDATAGSHKPTVSFGSVLGEGGMGVVHLAEQQSLGREVAIKRVRDAYFRDDGDASLVREALVTGSLAHPNIVPVYDLAQCEEARPFLVMKRIEGRPWDEVLVAQPLKERRGDWLEVQLRVLMSVCDAIHFAHSRGIIHRDLKPENVMIGHFNEVLVVDWGLAVSVNEEHRGRFPLAVNARHIAGTPAYMAPEQVTGVGAALGPHTDVYQLGAMLYEILTGAAPHNADSLYASLYSAYESQQAPLPDHISEPLAQICRTAMASKPSDRFDDVAAVRATLSDYLRHRPSIKITETAMSLVHELSTTLKVDRDDATVENAREFHTGFSRCKFGFLQALDIWPNNTQARDGLQAALTLMIEHSIATGEFVQAKQLLDELPHETPALRAKLCSAQVEHRRVEADLQILGALGARHDLRIGRNPRRWFTLGVAGMWSSITLLSWWWQRQGTLNGVRHTAVAAVAVVLMLLYVGVRHRSIRLTGLNQRMLHMATMTSVSVFALRLYAWQGEIAPEVAQPAELLLFFSAMGALSAVALRRLALPALTYAVASAIAAIDGKTVFLVSAAAHVMTLALSALLLERAAERKVNETN